MRYTHKLSAAAAIAFLGLSSTAFAVPTDPSPAETGVSACTVRTDGFFDCQVYEGPNETTTVTLPQNVVPGFIVLLENASSQDVRNWSDVVRFNTDTLDFLSDPTLFSDVINPLFLVEDSSGVTTFFSGGSQGVNNDYFFHSDADQVPEPATLTLLGVGLIGMAAARRRKKQQA